MNIDNVIEKINLVSTYILFVFLWAPHGARECIEICNGPYFVSPMLVTFLMPNWTMDLSLRGWLMQGLWSIPLLIVLFIVLRLRKMDYGKWLDIYILRWTLLYFLVVLFYNYVFWTGLRPYTFPAFAF